jgi:putative ABC transport system permease protein
MVGLVERFPNTAAGRAFVATELTEAIVGDVGVILAILLAGSALLLLLSCVNVATLLLARGATRTKELAVSSAQGATKRQLAGHFIAEAFVLAVAGAVLGFGVGVAGLEMLLSIGGSELPRMAEVGVDFDVLVFAGIVLVLTTFAVGLLPAVLLSEPNVAGLLGEGGSRGGGRRTHRFLSGLVMAEVALGVALVSGAGWLTRSYANLANVDPGFEIEGRLVFEALLAGSRYAPDPRFIETPQGLTIDPTWVPPPETPSLWLEELSDRLVGSGRVTAVGAALTMPLEREWDGGVYAATSPEEFDRDRAETIQRRLVTPDFFEAMGITLLAGRTFDPSDDLSVAVVNEEFARRILPGREPLGSSFFWGYPTVNFERPLRIVGVVEDVRYRSLREPAGPVVYILFYPPRANVVLSTTGADAREVIPRIVAASEELDPSIPIRVRPLGDVVRDELLVPRLALAISLLFAIVSLVLAAIGIYGVVALSTAQRSREMATRAALGASASNLASLIVSEGQLIAVAGIGIGVWGSYLAGRVIASRLYGVEATDPIVLGGAALAVFMATLIAHAIPAVRARTTPPASSLKVE